MKKSLTNLMLITFLLIGMIAQGQGTYTLPGGSLTGAFGGWGGKGQFSASTFNVNAPGGIDVTYYDIDVSLFTEANIWSTKGVAIPGVSKINSMTSIDPENNSIFCNILNQEIAVGVDWDGHALSTVGPDATLRTSDDSRHQGTQDWYRKTTGGKIDGPADGPYYNNESYVIPNPRHPSATPTLASELNKYDFRLRILPTGYHAYTYEMWFRMHKSAAQIEGAYWVYNIAMNNSPDAWRKFANGVTNVFPVSDIDLSSVYVFMGLGNFLDPASQTLTWGRIEVTGTPTRTTKIQNATVSSLGCGFIDVPVTVLDFTNVGAVSLVLNYVPAVLEYNSVTINSALTGASSNLPAAGQFRLSRLGNDGITLDPNAVLFTLHFKLLTPSTASTNLTWSTEPGDCEYAGPGGEPVYVGSFIDQGVTIPARPVKNLNTLREYCKIQDAINDPLTLNTHDIECSPGIYPEAVKINKSIHLQGKAGEMLTTFIQAPATLPAASDPLSNIVLVTGSGVNAEISGLTIKGPGPTACGSMGRGIFVRDGATANIHHNQILDIRDNPFSGCQNGIAIQVGRNVWSTTGTATIAYNLITGYQKGAIVVDNTGSNATISNNIITGAGTTAVIGQNGIQISRGATATLTGNTVSGNSFFSTGHPDNYCGTGILLYQSGSVALTGGNNLSNNDQNYYAYGVTGALTMGAEIFGASAAAAGFGNQIVNASTQDIDARACTFYGVLPSAMPLTDLFSLEDMIYHEIDNPTLGFVYVNTVNTYVTANSFDAPGYPDAQIQRGIDAAGTTGWTVNVGPGNFDCSMDIAKSIQVLGQGPANTIVDRSLNTTAGDIVYIHNLSGDVKVDGFTIKTGPASSVASNGVNIRTLTGPGTITISNNEIWGVQSATQTAKINYGLIAGYFTVTTPKLVFDNNKVFGGSDNPILIEKWMGPTEITNNFLYQNPLKDFSASDVIFMMNYGGSHNTQKQLISGNTIDMGWGTTNQRGAGISVASSYTGGTPLGGFTDVAISNNILLNLKPNRRGISTWNNSSNGTGGDITNAVISGNAISNAEGLTGEFGIRVLGKATGTQIANNLISGVIDAVLIQPYNTHEATTTFVNNNSLLATGYGIRNTTTATIAATCNWYGTTVAAAVALKISGAVTYLPWLTSGDDAAPTTPGFQPLVPCAACVDLALTQTHVDIACPLVPTGSINLSVGAGVSPFAFAWAGPGGFISAIEDPSGLAIGTYTVLVTAANGCTGTLSVELVLQDQPAPVVGTPGGSTVQCVSDAVVPASVPVVTDACGTVIPTPVPVMTSSIVNCEGTVTYTYTYTDYQPKSTVWTYVYTVDDITAPLITAPANVAVPTNSGCNATGVALGSPTVSDNCTPTGSLLVTNDHPSTTYPLGVTTVTWTVTDCSGLTNTAPQTVTVSGLTVSGTVKYLDSNLTPMNVTVTMNPGALVTTTNSLGVYTFTGVCSGPYEVIITSSKAPGGINATDAAQVNFWGVSPYPIQKAKFLAGDVDNDLSLLSNDAAAIQGYFLSAFTTGFTPPWSFWKAGETISANPGAAGNPVITVLNTNLTQDFYGLVTGDFNGSFTGLKSAPRTLELNYSETTQVANAAEFELPVTSESNLQVGAISLIMDYPSDQVSVEGVYLRSDRNVPVQYAVLGDELRISWYSLAPVSVAAGESLVTLKLRTIGSSSEEDILFTLAGNPLNELADQNYKVISDASLRIRVIKASSLPINLNPLSELLAFANYPNPFSGVTNFAYSLPVKGKVILEIRDMLGRIVKQVVNQPQTAGNHSFMMDAHTMNSGLYYATIRLITDNSVLTQTIKIVNTK